MADARLRPTAIILALTAGAAIWLAGLIWFAQVAQNSASLARLQNGILLISVAVICVLSVLIVGNIMQLVRDYRGQVPGARLTARIVTLLVVLTVVPLLVVYSFSLQFINRGIDSWFSLELEEGLEASLELSRSALDVQMRENLVETRRIAQQLAISESADLVGELGDLRRDSAAVELTVFGTANDRILANSSADPSLAVPRFRGEDLVFQLRRGGSYVNLEPRTDGGVDILAAVNVISGDPRSERDVLLARFVVEPQLGELVERAEASYEQYAELSFLRTPLKTSLTLTLSVVLLTGLLVALYGAFFSARRLVVPIQQLMTATHAVARGKFDTQLPTAARDEIGFLVNAFNDMTRRLAKADAVTRDSQQQLESERGKLEAILGRLSTGVIALESDLRIRTANRAASAILGVDLEQSQAERLEDVAKERPQLNQFLAVLERHLNRGDSDWREQIELRREDSRRVLVCACAELPPERGDPGGFVVVFDDITALLRAQRDAAWGEIARRLAHEIKNPLTPIQLSAERLRRRYLPSRSVDPELLDRSTYIIIHQVEALKDMVNAFSEYARMPAMDMTKFDLNELISEVAELYHHRDLPLDLQLKLDDLPEVSADAGRLRQVLHNLIRNAQEAMEGNSKPSLEISTRQVEHEHKNMVEIRIADNGPGFQPDMATEAFDPYVTSKATGSGLGLAIVKKLIDEHGGRIRAQNRRRQGAEIVILLPITAEAGGELSWGTGRHDKRREFA